MTRPAIDLSPEDPLKGHQWISPGHHGLPVLSVEQIRHVEQTAFKQVDSFLMMLAAGQRAARKILDTVAHSERTLPTCWVLAGPGNNGGDAFIVASVLAAKGLQVNVIEKAPSPPPENIRDSRVQGDRERARSMWNGPVFCLPEGKSKLSLASPALVIDGLLGIGCDSPPRGEMAELIEQVNLQLEQVRQGSDHPNVQLVSLDCPSGLNCDTGMAAGACIRADLTLSFIACKKGLLTSQGRDLAGQILVETLGCEAMIAELFPSALQAISRKQLISSLPDRAHAHHKGDFGNVVVLGGQSGMVGAAVLASRAALLCGAGRVAITLLSELTQCMPDVQVQGEPRFLDLQFPEIMNKGMAQALEFAQVMAVGPGLGQSSEALDALLALTQPNQAANENPRQSIHMVWDADALNLLALHPQLESQLMQYRSLAAAEGTGTSACLSGLVLTPHPLEAARLLGCEVFEVLDQRTEAARKLAERFKATVVLKGPGTLIVSKCSVTGKLFQTINTSGGPALATGGTGDVLAGALAALLAQAQLDELPPEQLTQTVHELVAAGVWLHGATVEELNSSQRPVRLSHASEVATTMHTLLNQLLSGRH